MIAGLNRRNCVITGTDGSEGYFTLYTEVNYVRFPFTRFERSDRSNCANGKQNVQR